MSDLQRIKISNWLIAILQQILAHQIGKSILWVLPSDEC